MLRQFPGADAVDQPVVLFVIDDRQETLALCALALMGMGLMAVTARSAEEGFERACLIHPDVVVLNGTHQAIRRLTRWLREDTRTCEAGLVVVPRTEPASEGDADGYDRLLPQSCSADALAFDILDVLRERRGRARR